MNPNRKLVLETGLEFEGFKFGSDNTGECVGEIVFNTSMVGYQEIISDPSYAGQIIVMTYPPMGQYGITDEDFESRHEAVIKGLVVREYCETPSNFRFTKTLAEELDERGIPGLAGPDTRMLTRTIRDCGRMKAAIVSADTPKEEALKMIAEAPQTDYVPLVSSKKRWFKRTPHHRFDVVVVDCGLKLSIIDCLTEKGCNVTVVPFDATAEEIMSFKPDGVIFSSGPGDPRRLVGLVETAKALKGRLPLAGIALGHEIIAMSYGASVKPLKAGHHGGRPVENLETGKIKAVEHNHDYTVDAETLPDGFKVLYEDVIDRDVEGLVEETDKVITVGFYPEGAPGEREESFFDKFIGWMEK